MQNFPVSFDGAAIAGAGTLAYIFQSNRFTPQGGGVVRSVAAATSD